MRLLYFDLVFEILCFTVNRSVLHRLGTSLIQIKAHGALSKSLRVLCSIYFDI